MPQPSRASPASSGTAPSGQGAAGRRIVVVGGGIAGTSAAEAARRTDPGARITLVSDEPGLPYYRLNLTPYLAGEMVGKTLSESPRPRDLGHTLCGYALDLAYEALCRK